MARKTIPEVTLLVAAAVRERIEDRGLVWGAVAEATGMDQDRLGRCLTGAEPFTTAEIAAISRALSITPADLVGSIRRRGRGAREGPDP